MEHINCPICETDQARFWGREYKGHIIVKCPTCDLRYVNPRRTAEENAAIYDDEKYLQWLKVYQLYNQHPLILYIRPVHCLCLHSN